jgi:hypothetical protein
LLGQHRKRKSNRPVNPKPVGLRQMQFLVLEKDGRYAFARIQLHLTLHHIWTLTFLLLSYNNSMEEEEEYAGTGRLYEDRSVGEWIRFAKYRRWVHTVCAYMEGDFVCEPCQG